MSTFERNKEVQLLIGNVEELHEIQLPSLKAYLLPDEEFIASVRQHVDIFLDEDRHILAAISLLDGLLNLGFYIDWAPALLNEIKCRKDLPEVNKLEEYANQTQLKQCLKYLMLKEELSSFRATSQNAKSIVDLATHFRVNHKLNKSNFLLLSYARITPYNPWIEDCLARNAFETENYLAAYNHWENIISKSNNIEVLEIATTELESNELSEAIEYQHIINDYSHILFEEAYFQSSFNSNNLSPVISDSAMQMAEKFMLFDDSLINALDCELNLNIWRDFKNDDVRHAARYFLRNKLFGGKTFLEAIIDDGGICEHAQIKRCQKHVDKFYYYQNRPDLNPNSFDAVSHYINFGWKEGTDPSKNFSTESYLLLHPHLKDLGINPLYHYICSTTDDDRSLSLLSEVEDFVSCVGKGKLLPQTPNYMGDCDENFKSFVKSDFFDKSKFWSVESFLEKNSKLVVHFVIPDFSNGSGGHMTIFRMIRHLEESGHLVKVWVLSPNRSSHSVDLRDDVLKYFQPIKAKVLPFDASFYFASGDCLVATSWQTVESVRASIGFREKFYFVQDYEPYFYPRGTNAVLAERTYFEEFACICASPWLNQIMKSRYSRWSRFLWLAYDKNIYKTTSKELKYKYEKLSKSYSYCHIAVYVRSHTERRCVELVLEALNNLHQLNDKFIVHFFGDPNLNFSVPYKSVNYGILSHDQLNALYSKCLIGLSFSATNYSLMPQEMMAAGLAVFDIRVESTEAIYPDNVINLMTPCPKEIAHQLNFHMDKPELLLSQAENALNWVNQFSWHKSGCDFENALKDRMKEISSIDSHHSSTNSFENLYDKAYNLKLPSRAKNAKYKASIVIPTHNGGAILQTVLESICNQVTPWNFQCILIDSESSDGTFEMAKQFIDKNQDFSLVSITKKDFQHGYTRNLGVQLSDSEYVCFLTQDSIPFNNKWLFNLVDSLEASPNAAGVFGKHVAHDDADKFTKYELQKHFEGFEDLPVRCIKF